MNINKFLLGLCYYRSSETIILDLITPWLQVVHESEVVREEIQNGPCGKEVEGTEGRARL